MIRALDMVNLVLRSANWAQTTGVSTIEGARSPVVEKALQAVNRIGLRLGQYAYWRWLYREGSIVTIPEVTTGTVDVTEGSAVVSGTGTAWEPSMVGRTFHSGGYEELYEIKAVPSPTVLELTLPYNGTTATGKSYHIVEDFYRLPDDFDSEVQVLQFVPAGNLRVLSPEIFNEHRFGPMNGSWINTAVLRTGDPQRATIIGKRDEGYLYLRLDPFPKDRRQVRFIYYAEINNFERDDDAWPWPEKYESVLEDGALAQISLNGKNEPAMSQAKMNLFFQGRDELAGVQRRADAFARFTPDTGLERQRRWSSRGRNRIRQGVEDERITP